MTTRWNVAGASHRSHTPDRLAISVGVFCGALAILILRWPSALFHAELRVEDGTVFYLGALLDGPAAIVQPYHGAFQLGSRLAAQAASMVPVAWAPVVMNSAAVLVTAAVATFIAGPRMAQAIPMVGLRVAVAMALALLPSAAQLTWSATFIGWSLAFFLVARLAATPPRRPVLDGAAVAIAAFSGPIAILLAPLYVWRRLGAVTWIVCGAAVIQIVVLVTTHDRAPGVIRDPIEVVQSLALGGLIAPVLGRATWSLVHAAVPITVGIGAVAVVSLLAIRTATAVPRWLLFVLVYASTASAAAGVLAAPTPMLDSAANSRYFLLASWSIVAIAVIALATGRRPERLAALPLLCAVALATVTGFRQAPQPDYQWVRQSMCIGGSDPCIVPVYPGGRWNIYWPGRGQSSADRFCANCRTAGFDAHFGRALALATAPRHETRRSDELPNVGRAWDEIHQRRGRDSPVRDEEDDGARPVGDDRGQGGALDPKPWDQ